MELALDRADRDGATVGNDVVGRIAVAVGVDQRIRIRAVIERAWIVLVVNSARCSTPSATLRSPPGNLNNGPLTSAVTTNCLLVARRSAREE